MNVSMLIILIVVFLVYNLTLPGVPESMSATAYVQNRRSWMFTTYCLLTGILLMIPWMELTPDEWMFLPFISCVGICFAGVTPAFRNSFESPIHYGAATISFLAWLAWCAIICPWGLALVGVLFCLSLLKDKSNWTFYLEVITLNYTIFYLLYTIWKSSTAL